MKEYIVVRIANKADGTAACPVSAFEDEVSARKEFFRLCGQAVDSVHPMDAVALLTKQGFELDWKVFAHEVPPEPEEVPAEC